MTLPSTPGAAASAASSHRPAHTRQELPAPPETPPPPPLTLHVGWVMWTRPTVVEAVVEEQPFQLPVPMPMPMPVPMPMPRPAAAAPVFRPIIERFLQGCASVYDLMVVTTSSIGRCERWEDAMALLDELRTLIDPSTGQPVKLDKIVINATMIVCVQAGRDAEALALFDEMVACGLQPCTNSYNTAIRICRRALKPDDALALLGHMREHGRNWGAGPDAGSYSGVIRACGLTGRIDDALQVFDTLLEEGPAFGVSPDNATYTAIITACGINGRHQDALRLFRQMRERGLTPDAINFANAISSCGAANADMLLEEGIVAGVFRASLGFDPALDMLDLHERAVLAGPRPVRAGHYPARHDGIHAGVARAIFRHLHARDAINRHTRIAVGWPGSGPVKEAIEHCMLAVGWEPAYMPRGGFGTLRNQTFLTGAGSDRGSGLNPYARDFVPDRR